MRISKYLGPVAVAVLAVYYAGYCIGAINFAVAENVSETKGKETEAKACSAINASTCNQPGPLRVEGSRVNIKITDTGIDPGDLIVKPGTSVVWVNSASRSFRIKFLGRGISTTCRGQRGFEESNRGFKRSVKLEPGDFATICLLKPKEYQFAIEYDREEDSESSETENKIQAGEAGRNPLGRARLFTAVTGKIRVKQD